MYNECRYFNEDISNDFACLYDKIVFIYTQLSST